MAEQKVTIQTSDLERTFQALRASRPHAHTPSGAELNYAPSPLPPPNPPGQDLYGSGQNYPAPSISNTGGGPGGGIFKKASAGGNVIYGQPQFFSPVHTPINWQIPSKRREIYTWSRFFYENEPKVASAIDFFSKFPINRFTNECKNRYVKRYFDKLVDKLKLDKWLRIMSHETHLLGDCFPFLEILCERCHDSGFLPNGEMCAHEGGEFKRLVILNPEFIEVQTTPLSPDPIIALIPDDELRNMVMKRLPGHDRLSPRVKGLIAAGMPIPLDNRSVSHIKFGESGYSKFGIGMIRRLFPILAYKTKLMTAQWIVAERLILPIKIVKLGSDERPAGPQDIANVQSQLAQASNDPNVTLVVHHTFDLDFFGACHDLETEVLTDNGWKYFDDVEESDRIGTLNLHTNCLEYQLPIERHEYQFDGNLITFSSKFIDVCVTPNHMMLAYHKNNWKKMRADKIVEGMRFFTDEMAQLRKQDIGIREYHDRVWCFTVPNGLIVTRRNGKVGVHGNSGKVLTLSNEFELIAQEILDGLMINKALLNGEGPTYSSAAIGIEVMIHKLEQWRSELAQWIEQKIYLPVARMRGFVEKNEWGEDEYIYPKVKWDIMHLRDQQNYRQFMIQLYEKGVISTKRLLDVFDIDYDQEVELVRFERAKAAASGAMAGGAQPGGMGGGFGGGGGGGGGMPGMDMGSAPGGMPNMDMGGGGGTPGGMPGMPGAGGGGAPGGIPGGAPGAMASETIPNIGEFGGKILTRRTREKVMKQREKMFKQMTPKGKGEDGFIRDEMGRVTMTNPEREILRELVGCKNRGELKHQVVPQFPVKYGDKQPYTIDFGIPSLMIGVEVDGELFHGTDEQIASDKRRDSNLAQLGWTILRFTEDEIDIKLRQCVETILNTVVKKENALKQQKK